MFNATTLRAASHMLCTAPHSPASPIFAGLNQTLRASAAPTAASAGKLAWENATRYIGPWAPYFASAAVAYYGGGRAVRAVTGYTFRSIAGGVADGLKAPLQKAQVSAEGLASYYYSRGAAAADARCQSYKSRIGAGLVAVKDALAAVIASILSAIKLGCDTLAVAIRQAGVAIGSGIVDGLKGFGASENAANAQTFAPAFAPPTGTVG